MTVSRWNTAVLADGSVAISTIDKSALVSAIQTYATDSYFDTTSKLDRVVVYYVHENGRQQKRLIHDSDGSNLISTGSWAPGAQDGTWQKVLIRSFDPDGASNDLPRSAIGTAEDITHYVGVMYLNT